MKDPSNYSWITYLWVMIISLLGGTAHNIHKIKIGVLPRFSLAEWIGDMVIAGFLGLITFYLCEWANLDRVLSAALIGIVSHQGSKGIYVLENFLIDKYINKFIKKG